MSVLFHAFLLSFLSLKSPVCLLSKDMRGKYRKVDVKVQKDTRKTNSKRQSNDTFHDAYDASGWPYLLSRWLANEMSGLQRL